MMPLRPLSGAVLTAAQMRTAELECGIALDVLMQRAGHALADAARRFGSGAPVLVLCGPGNNGGDGYVAAETLRSQGITVRVAASAPAATDLASQAAARWQGVVDTLEDARPAPVLIDALFGTGLSRPLGPDVARALERFSQAANCVIAADLPSGASNDDGGDLGAVAADITIAFGAAKPAHLLQPLASRCGQILIADLGIATWSNVRVLARPCLHPPGPLDHKYTRGMLAVVAGEMPGAATLGVNAGARIAGYTVLVGKGEAPASVVRRGFQKTIDDPKLGAILLGPGLADTADNRAKLAAALASPVPLVLDAGALKMVAPTAFKERAAPVIITPHEGEFAHLFGASKASKLDRAREAAQISGATVVFKGSDTVIASPDGRATLCPAASPWLASAGTGDVLAGLIAAFLSRGMDAHDAASAGIWLHGETARRAGPALIADDLITHIPAALARCLV